MKNSVYLFQTAVEFEEVDAYGIAHHSRLICYLERARVRFVKDAGIAVGDGQFQLVLVEMNLRFLSPARMMEEVIVELSVAELRGASLVWNYRLVEKSQARPILEGKIKMASVDKNLKPTRFPEAVVERCRCFLQI